ncbi:uncharacterized protein BT62DRAFT_926928 [Guyanagaster necrorhizus]|uniref:Uncharacterized protein n=1 Tax=Guyanagaster necrorhizus TaxID=856835 RepID=A0A9P7W299_9AGAR|nr:uncharacterized protein BT62DRAFT_926928 [Guyanagaster necrorhizus MCA 3950]KAG7451269.1 hypothetical protein BT62DRAFT_926928 [Guyanagaster necrorhizus MCA 3950]
MFKRVDRRLKRKAEDDALGIDDELKQALGIPHNDSDDSDSSSDSSEDEAHAEDEDGVVEDEGDDTEVKMTIAQVLENPIYNSPTDIDMTACFVCPAKRFKGPSMIQIHLCSKHHTRRFSQYKQRCALASPQDDASEHIPSKDVDESSKGLSNRAKKKNARRISQAEKRKLKQAAFLVRKTKREVTSQEADSLQDQTTSKSSSQKTLPTGNIPPRKRQRTEKFKSLSL